MEIRYSTQFKRQYKKLPQKIRRQFHERLVLFGVDQNNARLRVHKLSGKYSGLWSMNVSGDI